MIPALSNVRPERLREEAARLALMGQAHVALCKSADTPQLAYSLAANRNGGDRGWRSHVAPDLPQDHQADQRLADAQFSCQAPLTSSVGGGRADEANQIRRQFRLPVGFSILVSALGRAILGVVEIGPQKEVRGTYAAGRVTVVADFQSVGDVSVLQAPRNPMDQFGSLRVVHHGTDAYNAVAATVHAALPQPTILGTQHASVQTVSNRSRPWSLTATRGWKRVDVHALLFFDETTPNKLG